MELDPGPLLSTQNIIRCVCVMSTSTSIIIWADDYIQSGGIPPRIFDIGYFFDVVIYVTGCFYRSQ